MALYRSPEYQTSFESVGLSAQEKQFKIYFQDDGCDGHLGILIRTILAIFDLQVTRILPTNSSQLAFWFRRRNSKQICKTAIILDF